VNQDEQGKENFDECQQHDGVGEYQGKFIFFCRIFSIFFFLKK
jgi:hypothetical protein